MIHANKKDNHSMLSVPLWADQSPYFKALQSRTNQKQIQVLKQAMVSYNKRLAPKFPWKAVNKIQDDIKPVVTYFAAGSELIRNLLEQKTVPPFCFELLILVKDTAGTHKMAVPDLDDTDSDDDDEEDDEDDGDESKEKDDNEYFDNIEGRLKKHNKIFTEHKINPMRLDVTARNFGTAYQKFQGKMSKGNSATDAPLQAYPRKKYVH